MPFKGGEGRDNRGGEALAESSPIASASAKLMLAFTTGNLPRAWDKDDKRMMKMYENVRM